MTGSLCNALGKMGTKHVPVPIASHLKAVEEKKKEVESLKNGRALNGEEDTDEEEEVEVKRRSRKYRAGIDSIMSQLPREVRLIFLTARKRIEQENERILLASHGKKQSHEVVRGANGVTSMDIDDMQDEDDDHEMHNGETGLNRKTNGVTEKISLKRPREMPKSRGKGKGKGKRDLKDGPFTVLSRRQPMHIDMPTEAATVSYTTLRFLCCQFSLYSPIFFCFI